MKTYFFKLCSVGLLAASFLVMSCKQEGRPDPGQNPADRTVYLDAGLPLTRAGMSPDSEGLGFTIDCWLSGDMIRMVYQKDDHSYASVDFTYNEEEYKFKAVLPKDVESLESIGSDIRYLVFGGGYLNPQSGNVEIIPFDIDVDMEWCRTNAVLFASADAVSISGETVYADMTMDYSVICLNNESSETQYILFAKKSDDDLFAVTDFYCDAINGVSMQYSETAGVKNGRLFPVPAHVVVYYPIADMDDYIGVYWGSGSELSSPAQHSLGEFSEVKIQGGDEPGPGPGPGPEPINPIDPDGTFNLSAYGNANCYIASAAGKYRFLATKGNQTDLISNIASVVVLWESFGTSTQPQVGDLVSNLTYGEGNVRFTASSAKGNAVIAAKDANGTVIWSWHIWMTDQPAIHEYYCNQIGQLNPLMMDRNLGATSAEPGAVEALGLFYQWGRKDPFMGPSGIAENSFAASTLTWPASVPTSAEVGTVQYAIEHPTTFINVGTNASGDWLNERNTELWTEGKTMYDPCPAGYRLPYNNVWTWSLASSTAWTVASNFDNTNKGMNFGATDKKMGDDAVIWYPDQGNYHQDGAGIVNVGGWGDYWSITLVNGASQAYSLELGNNGCIDPSKKRNFAYGQAIRCQKIDE